MTQQYDPQYQQPQEQQHYQPSPQEQLSQYWDTMTPALSELEGMGFRPEPKPEYTYPTLGPRELSASSNADLGETLVRVNAWLSYAVDMKAYIKARLGGIDEELDQLMIYLLNEIGAPKNPETGKPYSKDDRLNKAKQNARHQQLTRHKAILEAEEYVLNSKISKYDRDWQTVSRQITLRQNLNESDRVTHGVGNRGNYPPGNYGAAR